MLNFLAEYYAEQESFKQFAASDSEEHDCAVPGRKKHKIITNRCNYTDINIHIHIYASYI